MRSLKFCSTKLCISSIYFHQVRLELSLAEALNPYRPLSDSQAMWAVLGLLVRHQGHLKSLSAPARRDDSSPESQLAAVLTAGKLGGGSTLLARPSPDHVLLRAAVEVQQLLMAGRQAEALKCALAHPLGYNDDITHGC